MILKLAKIIWKMRVKLLKLAKILLTPLRMRMKKKIFYLMKLKSSKLKIINCRLRTNN
jgi:hypothetical protein|nr:MAG TPA: hypothetical protein [Caudoviricetes sp.]